jgi:murein L,D-transpeptidase YafK
LNFNIDDLNIYNNDLYIDNDNLNICNDEKKRIITARTQIIVIKTPVIIIKTPVLTINTSFFATFAKILAFFAVKIFLKRKERKGRKVAKQYFFVKRQRKVLNLKSESACSIAALSISPYIPPYERQCSSVG